MQSSPAYYSVTLTGNFCNCSSIAIQNTVNLIKIMFYVKWYPFYKPVGNITHSFNYMEWMKFKYTDNAKIISKS